MRVTKVLLALVLASAVGCSGSSDGKSGADAERAVLDMLSRQAGAGSDVEPPPSLVDALPGSKFGQERRFGPITDVVAIGTVSDVAPHGGFVVQNGFDTPVPFDQEHVDGRYALVTLDVEDTVCTTVDKTEQLTFLFVMQPDDDLDTVKKGFTAMGKIIVFVKQYPDRQPGVYELAYTHGLVGSVGPDGQLDFPALRHEEADSWFQGGRTVDQLRSNCLA